MIKYVNKGENNLMKKKKSEILFIILMLSIGGVCGWVGATSFIQINKVNQNNNFFVFMLFLLIMLYLSIFLQIIIHECGHMIFGMLTGYRFLSLRFGPWMLIKQNEHIHLKSYSLVGTGGQCLLAPPPMKDGKIPFVLYNLGGSLMNFLFSVIAFLIYFFVLDISYLRIFFFIFGFIGIGFALMNGIPLQTSTINNDGNNVLFIRRNKDALKAFWIQMKMSEWMTQGYRLKDIPDEYFELPAKENLNNPLCLAIAIFKENRAMDLHQFDEAMNIMTYIRNNTENIMGLYHHLLINDEIYIHIIQQQTDCIPQMMNKEHKKIRHSMVKNINFIRTQYAYDLLYLKNEKKAQRDLDLFNKVSHSYPYSSDLESERELIQLIQELH